jgi:hypothetical protein
MAQVEFIQRTNGQQGLAGNALIARWLPVVFCLLLAIVLGVALPTVMDLPKTWAALVCLSICGGFVAVMWLSVGLPIVPILRLSLLASFWFRMEINLFPIFKNHAEPPGLNISLALILSVLLAANWFSERWAGRSLAVVLSDGGVWRRRHAGNLCALLSRDFNPGLLCYCGAFQ